MPVNLTTAATITRVMLYRGQPGTGSATVYTVPAATDVKIASMVFCNVTGTAATITISVVNSGGTAGVVNRVVSGLVVPPNSVVTLDTSIYMSTGDFIAALQGTAAAITVSISGETYA